MGRVKGREYFLAFNKVQPPRTPAERRQHMTNTFDVNAWWNEWVEALRATDYVEVGAPSPELDTCSVLHSPVGNTWLPSGGWREIR